MPLLDQLDKHIASAGVRDGIREAVKAFILQQRLSTGEHEPQGADHIGDLTAEVAVAVYLIKHCSEYNPTNVSAVRALLTGVKVFDINHFDLLKALIGQGDMSQFLVDHQGKDFLNPNHPDLKKVFRHYLPQYVADLREQFSPHTTTVVYPQNSDIEGQQVLSSFFNPNFSSDDFDFTTGYFGNVLIALHCDYVFKVSKREPVISHNTLFPPSMKTVDTSLSLNNI